MARRNRLGDLIMAYFTAEHENGTTWKLATPPKLRGEVMVQRAKNFARNYAHKHRLGAGVVTLTEDGGAVFAFTINSDYSI